MTVKLSKTDLDAMSGRAVDIQQLAKDARKIIADAGEPNLPGFQVADALAEVNARWEKKTGNCAGRWEYFAVALAETGEHVVATDKANEFYFPDVNVGVKD